jgi:hypothetical protein
VFPYLQKLHYSCSELILGFPLLTTTTSTNSTKIDHQKPDLSHFDKCYPIDGAQCLYAPTISGAGLDKLLMGRC